MNDQNVLRAVCLTVLFPEPVGPITLVDIKLDNALSRFLSRTLSRHHLLQSPLWSPSQVVLGLPEKVPELCEGLEELLLYHSLTLCRKLASRRS